MYSTEVSVTIAGDERDVEARAYVYMVGPFAEIDGDVTLFISGKWVDVGTVALAEGDSALIEDALYAAAFDTEERESRADYPHYYGAAE